ncbi:MAG TPA: hypothetical protein VFP22_06145 [Candidatus Limnocylindrales bacterium]|nr:hypothetical protein [Candidatus Limnocylindrales bacterium]
MAIDAAPRSRRSILLGALGGAGALVAHALGAAPPAAAANGDPVTLGLGSVATDNVATASTIVNSAAASPVLAAKSTGAVTGVKATTAGGTGVWGQSGANPPGGTDTTKTGVYGFADQEHPADIGVWGDSIIGTGLVGTGGWGVAGSGTVGVVGIGLPPDGTGVHGYAGTGDPNVPAANTAIHGHAGPGATTGIYASASSATQTALYVSGKFKTSRSGRATIGATATAVKVTVTGATSASWAIATLQTSVSGCYVRAAVPSTNALTIYLSKAPGKTVAVGYLVMN